MREKRRIPHHKPADTALQSEDDNPRDKERHQNGRVHRIPAKNTVLIPALVPAARKVTGVTADQLHASPALDAHTEVRFQPDDPPDSASTLQVAEYSASLVVLDL